MLNIKRLKYIVYVYEKKIQYFKLSVVFIIKCFFYRLLNIYKCNEKFFIFICFINKLASIYVFELVYMYQQ